MCGICGYAGRNDFDSFGDVTIQKDAPTMEG